MAAPFPVQPSSFSFCSAGPWLFYIVPMQLVAPSAVTIAVAILAIICTMNFNVSFFVIMVKV
jgi:hypothetical protein